MDMLEVDKNSDNVREIRFLLVSSNDFREFEGVWTMQRISDAKTALYYTVTIVPKGIIPVRAIEWRISEDVPDNMHAVRMECERRRRISIAAGRKQNASNTTNPHLQ